MQDFMLYMIPFIAAAVSTWLFEWTQKVLTLADQLPVGVKRAISAALSYGLNLAGIVTGVAIGMIEPTSISQEQITALLSGGLAYFFHTQNRNKRWVP